MSHMEKVFSELELDALKEFINIGFGRAAGELSEIMNLHVMLNVPDVAILRAGEVGSFIGGDIKDHKDYSIVEQFFIGNFKGVSFLVLPFNEGKRLMNIFSEYDDSMIESYGLDVLQQETLIEIGNIIIGACVGSFAELLKGSVSYLPPKLFKSDLASFVPEKIISGDEGSENQLLVSFKTIFRFEDHDVMGYLFMVSHSDALEWIRKSIRNFLDEYS